MHGNWILLPLLLESNLINFTSAFVASSCRNVLTTATAISKFSCISLSANYELDSNGDSNKMKNTSTLNRRSIFKTFVSSASLISIPSPAYAKKKEPSTPETIANAFARVRNELISPDGGVAKLESYIETGKWAEIKEFTKIYDAEFRKETMGRTRKLLPDGKMRGDSIQLCNNVTFDLIGINRASRVGDKDEAKKYLQALKDDIAIFLELEGKVVWE